QHLQHLPFGTGQVYGLPRVVGGVRGVRGQVDGVPADPGGRCGLGRVPAAGDGADAGEELVDAEGLGGVGVGAGVERVDLVAAAGTPGQHDDRHRGPAAQSADDVNAVDVGQAQIEHDQVRVLVRRGLQRLATVEGSDDIVLAGGQVDAQGTQE